MNKAMPCTNPRAHDGNVPLTVSAGSIRSRIWAVTELVICLVLTGGVLAHLLTASDHRERASAEGHRLTSGSLAVRIVGPRSIAIRSDSPLARKLQVVTIRPTKIKTPVLMVTGTVLASLRPGRGKGLDYWQFNSPELLTTFTDWQKTTTDIAFADTQLIAIKQLADTRIASQQKLVDRMKRLVAAGTDAEKDLAAAQAELIQSQIQGRKEIHEAQSAVRLARRTEGALARQLQQAGVEPELLLTTASDLDIVTAEVPEGFISRVKVGQSCEASFFGLPDLSFSGKVRTLSPVVSRERRSLRALFAISDPRDQLRPGLFADIGLGTDPRDALLIPAEGVIHVGRSDYVLVKSTADVFKVVEVRVGELHDTLVEVLGGLRAGDQVSGKGTILLKPQIIQALQWNGESTGGHS